VISVARPHLQDQSDVRVGTLIEWETREGKWARGQDTSQNRRVLLFQHGFSPCSPARVQPAQRLLACGSGQGSAAPLGRAVPRDLRLRAGQCNATTAQGRAVPQCLDINRHSRRLPCPEPLRWRQTGSPRSQNGTGRTMLAHLPTFSHLFMVNKRFSLSLSPSWDAWLNSDEPAAAVLQRCCSAWVRFIHQIHKKDFTPPPGRESEPTDVS
jgi:hypothetical protein